MRLATTSLTVLLVLAGASEFGVASDRWHSITESDPDPTLVSGSLRIDRGAGKVPLWIPPGEELRYNVTIDLGIFGSVGVGKVTLSTGIEDFRPGLPLPGERTQPSGQKTGWMRSYAQGGHLGYSLEHEILTRVLPTLWPQVVHLDTQTGSEARKREIKIGERAGTTISSYRNDGHCSGCKRKEHYVRSALPWGSSHHCKRCKRAEHRVWRDARERSVPPDALDMLSAVYVARTFMREGWAEATLPVIEKTRYWNLGLSRGAVDRIDTPAGSFRCTEVLLRTELPPGEPDEGDDFSGLFGIRGDIHIWMDSATGVPVLIQGQLPVGNIMELGVDVRLEKHEGTPSAFGAVARR